MSVGRSTLVVLIVTFSLVLRQSEAFFEDGKTLETKELLFNYGEAHDMQSVVFIPHSSTERVYSVEIENYNKEIITHVDVRTVLNEDSVKGGATNITCEFSFEATVGVSKYSLSVRTKDESGSKKVYSMHGEYVIVGLVLTSGNSIVSGENSVGLKYESYEDVLRKGPKTLKIVAQNPAHNNKKFDLSRATISVNSLKGGYTAGVIDQSCISIKGNHLEILPKPYRVSDEPQIITITYPDFEMDGEVFETVIMITVPNSKTPPPVVTGPGAINMTLKAEKEFDLNFFNLMSPPQKKRVQSVTVMARGTNGAKHEIATASYAHSSITTLEESMHFKSSEVDKEGLFTVDAFATFEDGSKIPCHMEQDIQLRVAADGSSLPSGLGAGAKDPSSVSGAHSGLPAWGVGMIAGAGGLASILVVVFALVAYRRQREAELEESDFSRSGPAGVPMDFANCDDNFVLRDKYARSGSGSFFEEAAEVTREEASPTISSSQCEF